MRVIQLFTVGFLVTLVAGSSLAHPVATPSTKPGARTTVVAMTGEIVDPQCYFMHDARGLEHAPCATRCARGGQGLAFLDEQSGKVYPLIAATHGANQNEKVLPSVGKRVSVKGIVFTKGQDAVLQVQSVAVVRGR